MKKLSILFFALSVTLVTSCGEKPQKSGEELLKDSKKTDEKGTTAFSIEVLNDIVKSIPTPLEISFLIKDLDILYDKSILNSAENTNKYNTDHKRALNLGVYSTNLGYANIYKQTQDGLYYLKAVKDMADALKIGQFFDFNTIKKLAISGSDSDSLLNVTTSNLESINDHLQDKKRSDLTILILAGGWIESLHLTCEVAKKQPNELLNNRIGEQKVVLDQLLVLLSFYHEDEKIKELQTDMNNLSKIYESVKITYKTDESSQKKPSTTETKTSSGADILMVDPGGTSSEIVFTTKDLENISAKVKEIRKKITD